MELHDYVRALRRRWFVTLSVALIIVAGAAACTLLQPREYSSSSKIFVSTQQASSAVDLSQGNSFLQQAVQSYADVVTTPIVLRSVIAELGLDESVLQLSQQISANAPVDTVVLTITVRDRTPLKATQIANAVSDRLAEVVPSLSPSTTGSASPVKLTTIQPASVPSTPSSPNIALNLIIGGAVGLLAGIATALIRERLDNRVRGVGDVALITDRSVLGSIQFDPTASERPLIVQAAPNNMRSEAFKALRTSLQFLDLHNRSRSLVITSSIESEGKSTTVCNLAIALAQAGKRVLVVDADLRRPKVEAYLGVEGEIGLTDVLIGASDAASAIQEWGMDNLFVLPAGHRPPNPSELLQADSMVRLMEKLQGDYDFVLYDAPPLLPVTDAAILARRAAGAIMVCAATRTKRQQLAAAIRVLDGIDARVLGVVLTMVPTRGPDAYNYDYQYGYVSSPV